MAITDYYVGQRIIHRTRSLKGNVIIRHGTVEAIGDGILTVAYDNSRCRGEFDNRWLELAPQRGVVFEPA